MKSTEFCYWLQGFFELQNAISFDAIQFSAIQTKIIKKHLDMVFIHEIDPSYPQEQQSALNHAHNNNPNDLILRC